MSDLPTTALSVRQPWAWAIIYGGKDIENRGPVAVNKGGIKPRRIAIHASKGMTRDECEFSALFMEKIGVTLPPSVIPSFWLCSDGWEKPGSGHGLGEFLHQRREPVFGHVRDQFVEHAALPEQ